MLRILLVAAALGCALAACGKSCPPDKPCALPDAGTLIDCGKGQCTGDQICVVQDGTCPAPDWKSSDASCVPRSSQCSDVRTQAACVATAGGTVDAGVKLCAFSAGEPQGQFNECNYFCL